MKDTINGEIVCDLANFVFQMVWIKENQLKSVISLIASSQSEWMELSDVSC